MTHLWRQTGSALFCGSAWAPRAVRDVPPHASPVQDVPLHASPVQDVPGHAVLLHSPLRVISGTQPEALPAALDEVESELAAGRIVAGFMCYEAGRAYGLQAHEPWPLTPLYWFGVYERETVGGVTDPDGSRSVTAPTADVPEMSLNVTRDEYCAAIARIKDYIAAGDTYQVNYTCHARFAADLDPLDYFLAMVRSHPVPYAAYLNLGDTQIISLSPELLLEKRGPILKTKPMKGTRKRGRTPVEDAALREELTVSLKDRAENLMIVDMMRNDLGRICEVGSVATPILFEAEKYRSVWQMTTTVTGRLREGVGLAEIVAATLPGSSVTGAPKQHTMEIIHELEREPRGVYCGAIGLFQPGEGSQPHGDFTLNLPIRTLIHRDGRYDLGIGAGIVWDSDPLDEYEETLLKSQFARRLTPDLRLFETLLAARVGRDAPNPPRGPGHPGPANGPSGTSGPMQATRPVQDVPAHAYHVAYEAEHLARLAQSAAYWDFPFDVEAARDALHAWVATGATGATASPAGRASVTNSPPRPAGLAVAPMSYIVRMELDQEGGLSFTGRALPPAPEPPVRVLISDRRTDSADRFRYHKTNQRALYDAAREQAMREGVFEVLFRNEAGNLTEGAISNLFVRIGRRWLTPPLMDGLLPGIWRADFAARNSAAEDHITPEMLTEAEEVVVGNSVRGAIRVDEVVLGGRVLYPVG